MRYNKQNPLRVFEAFAGYGSQSLALKRLKKDFPDFDFVNVGISEIEPAAITAYNALHGDVKNYGDISKVDWSKVPDFDLFTYSFPCTDISQAGRQEGLAEGSGTRSSLLWECQRTIEMKKPKFLLMENVKALISDKFIRDFNRWQSFLEKLGYVNFAQVLNAKDYGVPQNRERIFLVSVRIDSDDPNPRYYFPEPFPLKETMRDRLEKDGVDEKYYLSDERIAAFVADSRGGGRISEHQWGIVRSEDETLAGTVMATDYKDPPKILVKDRTYGKEKEKAD